MKRLIDGRREAASDKSNRSGGIYLWRFMIGRNEGRVYTYPRIAGNNFFLGVVEEEKEERRKKDTEIKKMRVFARA